MFCPTPTSEVQSDHFLHYTPKLGIAVEMVQYLLKLLLKQRFLAVHLGLPDGRYFTATSAEAGKKPLF